MEFHTFGDPSRDTLVLIHGVLTPWQIWGEAIAHFEKKYYVVVPALDGHSGEAPSDFVSIEQEAEQIESYILTHREGRIRGLGGLSMGGAVSWEIFRRNRCRIDCMILDGAPLVPMPWWLIRAMTGQYRTILKKSRARDPGTLKNFSRVFLPEKYLQSFLKIADGLEDSSAACMTASVGKGRSLEGGSPETRILLLYGTKLNERYSRKSAGSVVKQYPGTVTEKLPGYAHAELTVYHPDRWIRRAEKFLSGQT